ncbi:hypothetical protein [Actinoplanes subtropicus]|uniref:hypothetical protein n=1 Tax=Actinoplanes subtropicus TaxID=543632 RepID=UPI0004C43EBE|nr:hypothetical protein [Actinoplanes subtropicus]
MRDRQARSAPWPGVRLSVKLEDQALRKKGLQQKIGALLDRWPDGEDSAEIRADVKWVADRRNAFAHSLLDEADLSDRFRGKWTFDAAAVEDAFIRVGSVAESFAVARDL